MASYEDEFEAYLSRVTEGGREPVVAHVERWESPATAYPRAAHGAARIVNKRYGPGAYMSFDVRGTDLVIFDRRCTITALEIDRQVWMVDDPWHYWSIADTAAALSGDVLVGGLGLGLIVHELRRNPKVGRIVVVERDPDVIRLVGPLVPECEIVRADMHDFAASARCSAFDAAFVDLWVTHGTEQTRAVYYGEVIPLAFYLMRDHGVPMHALGFNGGRQIVEQIGA